MKKETINKKNHELQTKKIMKTAKKEDIRWWWLTLWHVKEEEQQDNAQNVVSKYFSNWMISESRIRCHRNTSKNMYNW